MTTTSNTQIETKDMQSILASLPVDRFHMDYMNGTTYILPVNIQRIGQPETVSAAEYFWFQQVTGVYKQNCSGKDQFIYRTTTGRWCVVSIIRRGADGEPLEVNTVYLGGLISNIDLSTAVRMFHEIKDSYKN